MLDGSRVKLSFATITAPFDGVITRRQFNPFDFIASADGGSKVEPLLTVERIDKMRVVVNVPEREARLIEPGKTVEVEFIDVLPGQKMPGKVSRVSFALDPRNAHHARRD